MKKILIALAIILVGTASYFMWGGAAPESVEGSQEVDAGFGSSFRKSISNILPGKSGKAADLGHQEEGDHIVVIKSQSTHMEVDDAIERLENLKDSKDQEALVFARWSLFNEGAKYSQEEKERLFERATELLPAEQVTLLSRDILLLGNMPEMNEKALSVLTKGMGKEKFKSLVIEILEKRKEPEVRASVIEFAASKNIYVR